MKWVLIQHRGEDENILAETIIREVETTHVIVDPEEITEIMLDACFGALPEHYDPPDPKRRTWHAFKAKRRFTAMAKTVRSILK